MTYYGDFLEDSSVYMSISTSDSSGGAVAPSSAFEAADVRIYKNDSATQKTSTNGITMTSPFDTVTGAHVISIDTSNDTGDAGFWETGAEYTVWLMPDETVDSQTVVYPIGTFSIERDSRANAVLGAGTLNVAAESYTLTTGTQSSGTFADSRTNNGVRHEHTDATGAMELYYQFGLGGDGRPTSVSFDGYMSGNGDNVGIYAYDWGATSWEQVGTLNGKNASTDDQFSIPLLVDHVGTGANLGKVRIRFYAASGLTTATLRVDQLLVQFAIVSRTVGYQGGAVWVDTLNGQAGTESYVNGTADNPVDTLADGLTLLGQLGLSTLQIAQGSTITPIATIENLTLRGLDYILNLNGQQVGNTVVTGAVISGTALQGTGSYLMERCKIGTCTLPECAIVGSALFGTITANTTGTYFLDRCSSAVAGGGFSSFDFGAAIGNVALSVRHHSGGFEIQNYNVTGTDTMTIEGMGQIVGNANCGVGTVEVRGHFVEIDNSGNLTFNNDPNFLRSGISASVGGGTVIGQVVFNAANTASVFDTNLVHAGGQLHGRTLIFTAGAQNGEGWEVMTFVGGAGATIMLNNALSGTPAPGDPFILIANNVERGTNGASTHSAVDVRTEMEGVSTKLTDVKDQTDQMAFTGTDVHATLDGEQVDLNKVKGETDEGDALAEGLETMHYGTVVTPQTLTQFLVTAGQLITGNPDHWKDRSVYFVDGVLAGCRRGITASEETGAPLKVQLTVDALPAMPSASDKFRII
jgi:hypothetical protein